MKFKKLFLVVFLEVFIYADILMKNVVNRHASIAFDVRPLIVYTIFSNIFFGLLLSLVGKNLTDGSNINKWLSLTIVIINAIMLVLIYHIKGQLYAFIPIVIGYMIILTVNNLSEK